MDIVVAYCEQWDTPLRTSKHHYIERLAELGHRILYIEIPVTPLSILKRPKEFFCHILPSLQKDPRPIKPNIWAMTGIFLLPYHKGFGGIFDKLWLNKINQFIFLRKIKKVLKQLNFNFPSFIIYYPLLQPIMHRLPHQNILFHIVDEWQALTGIPLSMAQLTEKMLQQADATVVSAQRLLDRYQAKSKRIVLIRHGTDISLFAKARQQIQMDSRLQALASPRIGYYGALHKLDFELIKKTALSRPDWSFVFIGPSQGSQGYTVKTSLPPNVYIWSPLPREKLPFFLAGIEVFWMPFVINELTESMCSIKIYEILAAGLPIVMSDLKESKMIAKDLALYATDANSHLICLNQALKLNAPDHVLRRREAVKDCSWENRLNEFLKVLQSK